MENIVIFHLKRIWEGKDLWEEIKSKRKTSEWRDLTNYWSQRLMKDHETVFLFIPTETIEEAEAKGTSIDLTKYLKATKAWFVIGYPKYCVPRLEADITALLAWPAKNSAQSQFEIKIANVQEVIP